MRQRLRIKTFSNKQSFLTVVFLIIIAVLAIVVYLITHHYKSNNSSCNNDYCLSNKVMSYYPAQASSLEINSASLTVVKICTSPNAIQVQHGAPSGLACSATINRKLAVSDPTSLPNLFRKLEKTASSQGFTGDVGAAGELSVDGVDYHGEKDNCYVEAAYRPSENSNIWTYTLSCSHTGGKVPPGYIYKDNDCCG